MAEIRLDTLEGLALALGNNCSEVAYTHWFEDGQIYCPKCADTRCMKLFVLWVPEAIRMNAARAAQAAVPRNITVETQELLPSLVLYSCVQCKTEFTAVGYRGPNGHELAIFPAVRGGLATPRTPPAVAYYLDQASQSHSVGANSAAIEMYRAALEQLLYEQGLTNGMLANKIKELEAKIKDGSAPKWAKELDTAYLTIIKEFGNAAIHPNDGDVTKQDAFNKKLIVHVEITMQALLKAVYERPAEEAERLATLRAVAAAFKS